MKFRLASGRLPWVASIILAVLVTAAVAFAVVVGLDDKGQFANWSTYENREQGYRIQHPPDWTLQEESTKCDDTLCVQSIELKREDKASVFVFVNFQGGWCESSAGALVKDVVVSGYSGKEYRCQDFTIRDFGPGDSVSRYFLGAKGKINYLILGQAKADLSEVEAIIETFQFLD